MSVAFISFIDPFGKKGLSRSWIADDEDEIDFLDRVRSDLNRLKTDGYHIICVEVT